MQEPHVPEAPEEPPVKEKPRVPQGKPEYHGVYTGSTPPDMIRIEAPEGADSGGPWAGFELHPEGPLPYTKSVSSEVYTDTVVINGVPVTFAVRDQSHIGLIFMHIRREINSYALVYDAIEASRKADPTRCAPPKPQINIPAY